MKVEEDNGRDGRGRFTKGRVKSAAAPGLTPGQIMEGHSLGFLARPIVHHLPPNQRLVMCDVGPYRNVRVMVRPNNQHYVPKMVIPLDVDLATFDGKQLLIYNGNPPRRKGWW